MPEAIDTSTLLADLLRVLRARLAQEAFEKAPGLVQFLTAGLSPAAAPGIAAERVMAAIVGVQGLVGEALLAMVGQHDDYPETRDGRATRETIKNAVAQILARRKGNDPLSVRRVEQLEHEVLVPHVALVLGIIEEVKVPMAWRHFVDNTDSDADPSRDQARVVRELPVFVQYCNPELVRLSGLGALLHDPPAMLRLLRSATRLALLLTDDVVSFPASYLYEVEAFPAFLAEAGPVRDGGLLAYISQTPDLGVFKDMKLTEYRADEENPYSKQTLPSGALNGLIWRPRGGESTADYIGSEWRVQLRDRQGQLGQVVRRAAARIGHTDEDDLVDALAKVPERLAGQAFIGRFAKDASGVDLSPVESMLVDTFLSYSYLRSYLGDLDATILVDFPFGDLSCGISSTRRDGQYRAIAIQPLLTRLARLGLSDYILKHASWEAFMSVRALPELPYLIDTLAYHISSEATERALARTRHPAAQIESVPDLQRILANVCNALERAQAR